MANATSVQLHAVDPTDTVDPPAGGTRYTTLASFWAAEKGEAAIACQALCYSGGDLGVVVLSGASFTPTSEYYVHIYAHEDSWQDGTNSLTQGARITVADALGISTIPRYTRIEGLRFVLSTTGAATRAIYALNSQNLLIDGNCFVVTGAVGTSDRLRPIYLYVADLTPGASTIHNNLIYGVLTDKRATGILVYFRVTTGTHTMAVTLQNNSVSRISSIGPTSGATSGGIGLMSQVSAGASGTLTATSTNNISTGNAKDFDEIEYGQGTSLVNNTQTYCLSSDDSADDWGGAGNLIDQAADDVFVNPASDLTLEVGGPAMGKGDDLSDDFTDDAIGARRYDPWDMGALALFTGDGYRLYRGTGGIGSVDFDTIVATIPGGNSEVSLKDLGHDASERYTYVLRPVRADADHALLETPDYSCFAEFETDGDTEWLGERPGAVEVVEAEILSGGQIRLRWRYRTPYNGTAPADFGIYYQSTPQITVGSPQATETYTSDGEYSKDLTLTGGSTYYFAITARTTGGVESHLSEIIGPFIADDTAPSTPTLIASATF